MNFADLSAFPTSDALALLRRSEGSAYFIPEGYEPILVHESLITEEVRLGLRQSTVQMIIPISLRECRLPPYIVTKKKSLTRKPKGSISKPPPRPPNAFIIYRKDKQIEVLATHVGISNNEVSVIIGRMWREESLEVREAYHRRALMVKAEHAKAYPGYRFAPRRQAADGPSSVDLRTQSYPTTGPARTNTGIPNFLFSEANMLDHIENRMQF